MKLLELLRNRGKIIGLFFLIILIAFFSFLFLAPKQHHLGCRICPLMPLSSGSSNIITPPISKSSDRITELLRFSNVPLNEKGLIQIDTTKYKQYYVDIGTSDNAPITTMFAEIPDVVLFSLEPDPFHFNQAFQILRKHYKSQLFSKIHYLKIAVDEEESVKTFYAVDDEGQGSVNKPLNEDIIARQLLVPTITLAQFFSKFDWSNGIEYITHLKIDTQGNDLKVVKGAGAYLQERVVCLTMELVLNGYEHGHGYKEIVQFVEKLGFTSILPLSEPREDGSFFNTKYAQSLGVNTSSYEEMGKYCCAAMDGYYFCRDWDKVYGPSFLSKVFGK